MVGSFLNRRPNLWRALMIALIFPFLLFPFYHYHPGYFHSHPGHQNQHAHSGHYHSHEIETVAHFIHLGSSSHSEADGANHTHNSPEHQTDHNEFDIQKIQPTTKKPILIHAEETIYTSIKPQKNIGFRLFLKVHDDFQTSFVPIQNSPRSPPQLFL